MGSKDYRSGKHTLQEREGNPWTHSGTLPRGPGKNRKFIQPNRMEAWQSFTDHALEHSKLIKTKGYQLMDDLDKNQHDFLQTLRSFDSKLKPDIVLINESTKDIIIGELTCPLEARMTYWHETNVANRIAEKGFTVRFFAFEFGCRGKLLRKFLTALELPKKIIKEPLADCAITALKCSRKIFLSRSSFNFEPSC